MCTHHDGYLNPTDQSEQGRNGLTSREQGLGESSWEQGWGGWCGGVLRQRAMSVVAEEQGLHALEQAMTGDEHCTVAVATPTPQMCCLHIDGAD